MPEPDQRGGEDFADVAPLDQVAEVGRPRCRASLQAGHR
jgi:hypothetical protein